MAPSPKRFNNGELLDTEAISEESEEEIKDSSDYLNYKKSGGIGSFGAFGEKADGGFPVAKSKDKKYSQLLRDIDDLEKALSRSRSVSNEATALLDRPVS